VEVSSRPGETEPLESLHVLIPGPFVPSVHEKLVATGCPTEYVPPDAGEVIDACGAAATVYEMLAVPVCPSLEVAVTV
jgi:hypothetical protein